MDNIFSNTFTNGIYSHSKPQNISVHKQEKYKNHSYTANALKIISVVCCRYTQMY